MFSPKYHLDISLIRPLVASASVFLLAGCFMTHQLDAARGRDVVARWCALAERRLDYLTELFETGRWRRYHSERAFLENIQEAKAAVETWRDLLSREASRDNSAVDLSWLGRGRSTPPRSDYFRERAPRLRPELSEQPAKPMPHFVASKAEIQQGDVDEASAAPDVPVAQSAMAPMLDLDAMQQRYPLLRNAM
jgi:uncharacterized repeat protein (TIGR03809 family)